MVADTLERLLAGTDLTMEEAHDLMRAIMAGEVSEAQIAGILVALRAKGETAPEIAGFATAMRERALHITPQRNDLVDTCGTGGDARQTFNISTATALVAAAMGIGVAKHGNRAVSSRSGSADVLEALGVNIMLPPAAVAALVDRVGIGFLFAPAHHPAMKHAAPVRRQLGVRTVFNILGPLTNPAGVKRQLIGVFDPDLTDLMCRVLQLLGAERAFVVHGLDGSDEVSLSAETQVSSLEDGSITTRRFTLAEVGLEPIAPDALRGGTAAENAAIIRDVLDGGPGPPRDAVVLNAGFVAVVAGRTPDVSSGMQQAAAAIDSGRARQLLEDLCTASQEVR